jgi:hypothetical protein
LADDELEDVLRHKLHLDSNILPKKKLKALWCTLDEDNSNQLDLHEMRLFLERGALHDDHKPKFGGMNDFQRGSSKRLIGSISGDRVNMGEALASQKTKDMRAELEGKGVAVPEGDELKEISKMFNKRLEKSYADGQTGSHHATLGHGSWYNLFREVDEDGSGFVTFDELAHATRQKLKMQHKELSSDGLKALWCALDADDSEQCQADEFRRFLSLGTIKHAAQLSVSSKMDQLQKGTSKNLVGAISGDRMNMGSAIASQPTDEMRAELEAAGSPTELDDDELTAISQSISEGYMKLRKASGEKNQGGVLWHHLFALADEDGSGVVTCARRRAPPHSHARWLAAGGCAHSRVRFASWLADDELEDVLRHKLHQTPSILPKKKLKALWCTLDKDNSNQLDLSEVAGFLRRGAAKAGSDIPKFGGMNDSQRGSSKRLMGSISGDRVNMNSALASQPTSEMRRELEAKGVTLPADDQLTEMSKIFNEGLDKLRRTEGSKILSSGTNWHNIFALADRDGSGVITCARRDGRRKRARAACVSAARSRAARVRVRACVSVRACAQTTSLRRRCARGSSRGRTRSPSRRSRGCGASSTRTTRTSFRSASSATLPSAVPSRTRGPSSRARRKRASTRCRASRSLRMARCSRAHRRTRSARRSRRRASRCPTTPSSTTCPKCSSRGSRRRRPRGARSRRRPRGTRSSRRRTSTARA